MKHGSIILYTEEDEVINGMRKVLIKKDIDDNGKIYVTHDHIYGYIKDGIIYNQALYSLCQRILHHKGSYKN